MNKLVVSAALAAVCALPCASSLAAARDEAANAPTTRAAGQTDVPVKAVVLFSSGVGYFEHFGTVKGDGSTELRFKTDQINDVLKSLILQDLDKGQVGTVSYPSQEPIAKTLKSFQVDITANPPLADLLNQLRGAKIDVTLPQGAVHGTIVGVEKKRKAAGEKNEIVETWLLNLKIGHKFRAIAMQEIKDFELEDAKLEEELDKALSALAGSRDQDKKPVTIHFRGQGERRVRMGYVVETPIWKTSYRLVLSDAPAKGGPATRASSTTRPTTRGSYGRGKLQGWAIVENQTDNDWTDAKLSLVSGRPISYIQDLYHPLYVPRPVIFPDLYASLRPQTYQGGVTDEEQVKLDQQRNASNNGQVDFARAPALALNAVRNNDSMGRGGAGGQNMLFGNTTGRPTTQPPMDATASVRSAASATELGELFEYTVGSVTLPRQQSAMIPIVTDDIDVEKLSIYNESVLPTHPLNGAKVKNTTGKHLLQGPVTVLEAGSYAGDARIDDVPPGQERLLSYGIDLNVVVDPAEKRDNAVIQTGKIVKGVLEVSTRIMMEQTYVIQNKGQLGKTLIIEHAREPQWKLVQPAGADETTESMYRFRTHVEPGKKSKFTVAAEQVQSQEFAILENNAPIEQYIKAQEIPPSVRKALSEVAARKSAVADTQRQMQECSKQITDVSAEQLRIRENMKTVAPNSDYYSRLLKKLDEQETTIERVQKENADLQKQLERQRSGLQEYVAGLTIG